jgi:hypothetical protein
MAPMSTPPDARSRIITLEGQSWSVREVAATDVLPSTLVFAADKLARRVRAYPPNWYELPDRELMALSWTR